MLTLMFVVAAFAQTSQPVSAPTSQPVRLRTLEVTAIVTEDRSDQIDEGSIEKVAQGKPNLANALRGTYKKRIFHRTIKIDFEHQKMFHLSMDMASSKDLQSGYQLTEKEMFSLDYSRAQLVFPGGNGAIWFPGAPRSLTPVKNTLSWPVVYARLGILHPDYVKIFGVSGGGAQTRYTSRSGGSELVLDHNLGGVVVHSQMGSNFKLDASNFVKVKGTNFYFPSRVVEVMLHLTTTIDYIDFKVNPEFPRETFMVPQGSGLEKRRFISGTQPAVR